MDDTRSIISTIKEKSQEDIEKHIEQITNTSICEFPKKGKIDQHASYVDISGATAPPSNIPSQVAILRLSNSKLGDYILPVFKNLRTLFLDGCSLQTLQLPMMPNLRYLSVANNILTSYIGLSIQPQLVSFDIRNNPIEFSPESALQATGSINLTTFNGEPISFETICNAFSQSPLVGVALRQGLDPLNATTGNAIDFLSSDLKSYFASNKLGEAPTSLIYTGGEEEGWKITVPIEEAKGIRWSISTCPTEDGKEWDQINTRTPKEVAIKNNMYQRLVKAEFRLNMKDFVLYTDNVVGADTRALTLPYPITPKVSGEPREGSLISLIPMPVPIRVTWFVGEKAVLDGSTSIILQHEHVGQVVTCAMQPYCPSMPRAVFNELITKTDPIQPLEPAVTGITFPDAIVEGDEIRFTRRVVPDVEGESEIYVERAKTASDNWTRVTQLPPASLVYKPTGADVDCFLRISYRVVLRGEEGSADEPTYFYSSTRVLPGMPKFTAPVIAGDPLANRSIVAIATYQGGKKGDCAYEWYAYSKKMDPQNPFPARARKLSCTSAILKLGQAEVGLFLGCIMTPMRDDDVSGESIQVCTDVPVHDEDPLPPLKGLPKEVNALTRISLRQSCRWLLSSADDESGFEVAGSGSEFTPTMEMIGRYLRVVGKDVDFIIGEVLKPINRFVVQFKLIPMKPEVGTTISIPEDVDLEDTEVIWVRTEKGKDIVVDIDTRTYTATNEDYNSTIKAVVTPIGPDGEYYQTTESVPTERVKMPSTKALEISGKLEVGSELAPKATCPIYALRWMRSKDGHKWETVSKFIFDRYDPRSDSPIYTASRGKKTFYFDDLVLSLTEQEAECLIKCEAEVGRWEDHDMVGTGTKLSATPAVSIKEGNRVRNTRLSLTVSNEEDEYIVEGTTLTAKIGGQSKSMTIPQIVWERFDQNTSPMDEEERWILIDKGQTYKVTAADVGQVIRCRLVIANLKRQIETIFEDIRARPPSVTDVTITQAPQGHLLVSGAYSGGTEGASRIFISTTAEDGVSLRTLGVPDTELVSSANGRSTYKIDPWQQIFRKRVDAGYIPVRDDGTQGAICWSNSSIVVQPVPVIEELEFSQSVDKLYEGFTLECIVKATGVERCEFQWERIREATAEDVRRVEERSAQASPTKKGKKVVSPLKQRTKSQEKLEDKYEERIEEGWLYQTVSKRSDNFRYTITKDDDECTIYCTCWAINNKFESVPAEIHVDVALEEKPSNPHIEVVALGRAAAKSTVINTTKRFSDAVARADRGEKELFTGDKLEARFVDAEEDEVCWFGRPAGKSKEQQWKLLGDGPQFTVAVEHQGLLIRAEGTGLVPDAKGKEVVIKLSSEHLGPVRLNPAVESLAKAAARSGVLKLQGEAPVGKGKWDITANRTGIEVTSRNGAVKKASWKEASITPKGDNSIEVVAGPGTRFVMIPSIEQNKRSASTISPKQLIDMIMIVISELKGK